MVEAVFDSGFNLFVSIHAPARGRRLVAGPKAIILTTEKVSIHAPARGATLFHRFRKQHLLSYLFQSTLPRGERHNWSDCT